MKVLHSGPEVAKKGQNYLKDFFRHEIHQNRGFWGQGFQKCSQNLSTLAMACGHAKNCKNVCKIHVYRFICVWGQEFQTCNQKFCKINQLMKKSKFY